MPKVEYTGSLSTGISWDSVKRLDSVFRSSCSLDPNFATVLHLNLETTWRRSFPLRVCHAPCRCSTKAPTRKAHSYTRCFQTSGRLIEKIYIHHVASFNPFPSRFSLRRLSFSHDVFFAVCICVSFRESNALDRYIFIHDNPRTICLPASAPPFNDSTGELLLSTKYFGRTPARSLTTRWSMRKITRVKFIRIIYPDSQHFDRVP